jgi:large-conductance mechanosensitive channel
MDDTPGHFVQELRSSLLKKRAGQIALAVILAEAGFRFLNALTWFLIVPTIATVLKGHTESVLFETRTSFPWQQLLGSVLDFAVALIFVFYLNRWIHRTPRKSDTPLTAPDQLSEPGARNNAPQSRARIWRGFLQPSGRPVRPGKRWSFAQVDCGIDAFCGSTVGFYRFRNTSKIRLKSCTRVMPMVT